MAQLREMSTILSDMVALLRQGDGVTNPNTEQPDSKPLPWTALMCAAAFNDPRTVK
jgi:hypothetical protein